MSELTDERLDEIEALAAARTGDDYYCPSCRSAVVATYDERCCSCGSNAYVPDDDPLCVAVPELVAEVRRLKALDIDTAFCWHCKHVTSEFAFVCPECMDMVKRLEAEKVRARELYENAARDTLAFTAAIDPDGPTVEDVMKAYDEALRQERV